MCRCTPSLRTPWCGQGDCKPPTPGLAVLGQPSEYDRLKTKDGAAAQDAYENRLRGWLVAVDAERVLAVAILSQASHGSRIHQHLAEAARRLLSLMSHFELALMDYSNFDVTGTRPTDEATKKPDHDGSPA